VRASRKYSRPGIPNTSSPTGFEELVGATEEAAGAAAVGAAAADAAAAEVAVVAGAAGAAFRLFMPARTPV